VNEMNYQIIIKFRYKSNC